MLAKKHTRTTLITALSLSVLGFAGATYAIHSWGNYHWARTANPFTLKTVDSVTSNWDAYLDESINDWSLSSVLDLAKEPGSTSTRDRRLCRPVSGKIRACNYTYGNNGWLGIAQIWVNSAGHITQATTKVNDTYFNTATYNTPAWRRMVMCQEIAHDFGLDHQDETFDNANLGSCMDYTNDPDGGAGGASATDPSNEHPNAHDYEQIELIYAHLDSSTTIAQNKSGKVFAAIQNNDKKNQDEREHPEFGRPEKRDAQGRVSRYVKEDRERGEKLYTFIIWAE